ncbi:MAG: HNH endonuclease [Alphaproteobacteria bacterium]|nr:HNH endonuclease [Alphaproteobacteria bacterium]
MTRADSLRAAARNVEQAAWGELYSTLMDCSEVLKELNPIQRANFLDGIKAELHRKQQGTCAACDQSIDLFSMEIDHIIPYTLGGGNERANLQLICRACNRRKGKSVDLLELLSYLEDRYLNLR